MSSEEVGKAFCKHYYDTFNVNAEQLVGLFNERSMMTFEGTQIMGQQAIMEKLKSLGPVTYNPKSMDVQPAENPSSIIIFVTGSVVIGPPGGNPLHFSNFFYLCSTGPGQYYVHNNVFRLNYGL